MTFENYPHEASSQLPGVSFPVMRQVILNQAERSSLKVLEDAEQRLTVETAHGLIGLRPGDGSDAAAYVAAADEHWLFMMKNAVIRQMQHLMPETASDMRWSSGPQAGSLPPNFSFVEVAEVAQLGTVFLRLTLKGEDLDKHGDESIHFRFVLPPEGETPEWPTIAPNGSTKWPDGPGAPHKPVYTTRYIDHGTGTLVTDVFIHEGGRITTWAEALMNGARNRRVVGLVGPAGGGLLKADQVLMAADETGFPAAARLLENMDQGTTGTVLLEAEDGADCAYPIEVPDGITLRWLSRSKGEALGQATEDLLSDHQGATLWFAGERAQASSLREKARAAGWDKSQMRISGFWTR